MVFITSGFVALMFGMAMGAPAAGGVIGISHLFLVKPEDAEAHVSIESHEEEEKV